MKCVNCGTVNGDDARFCSECGEPLIEQGEDADNDQLISDRLGPYELRGDLGRGAMARVWRAYDPNLDREVAVKEPVFDPGLSDEVLAEMGRRFVAEGKAAAKLNHPGIVTIHAADVYDGRPAIVMELVDGETLSQRLERGRLQPAEALDVLDQLLDAVGHAHGKGIVHRDIKPDNIFITEGGQVKLADFGIAHVDDSGATRATMVGTVLGTPGYMSPEQAAGRPVDERSDLFSVGVVGYEMLAGTNPFNPDGTDATTLLYRIVHEPAPELPEKVTAGLPDDLRPAIMAALEKDPGDRPQSALAFREALHGGKLAPRQPSEGGGASRAGEALDGYRTDGGQFPKWLPYAAVAGVAAVVLGGMLVMSGGQHGGVAGGGSSPAVYLAASNGYVAIYTAGKAEPYQITRISVSDLSPSDAAEVDSHVTFSSVAEAQEQVQLYQDGIDAAKQAEADAEAAAKDAAEAAAAAQAEAARKAEEEQRNAYVIADSSSRYLSHGDIASLSDDELSIAMNEIWARHGRMFKNRWLQDYFNSKFWYTGSVDPDNFLNVYKPTDIEDANSKLINRELTARGYDVNRVHPN